MVKKGSKSGKKGGKKSVKKSKMTKPKKKEIKYIRQQFKQKTELEKAKETYLFSVLHNDMKLPEAAAAGISKMYDNNLLRWDVDKDKKVILKADIFKSKAPSMIEEILKRNNIDYEKKDDYTFKINGVKLPPTKNEGIIKKEKGGEGLWAMATKAAKNYNEETKRQLDEMEK